MNQSTYNDEAVMAYADGVLDTTTADALWTAAQTDTGLAARIELFKSSGAVLRRCYGPVLAEPIPSRLHDAISLLGRDDVLPRASRSLKAYSRRTGWLQALAASVLLVLTGAEILHMDNASAPTMTGNSLLAAIQSLPPALTTQLDKLPSGRAETLALAGRSATIVPMASYANAGQLCREFEVSAADSAARGAVYGLACREQGQWRVKSAIDIAARAPRVDEYVPASGSPDLGSAYGLGAALSLEAERQELAGQQ